MITDEVTLTGVAVPLKPRSLRLTEVPSAAPTSTPVRQVSLGRWRAGLLVADVLVGMAAALLAVVGRFGVSEPLGPSAPYVALVILAPLVWPAILLITGTFDEHQMASGSAEFGRIANAGLWTLTALVIVSYVSHTAISREVAFVGVSVMVVLSLGAHLAGRALLRRRLQVGRSIHRALVLGRDEEVRGLVDHIRRLPSAGLRVAGICLAELSDDSPGPSPQPRPESSAEILQAARRAGADTVVVAGSGVLSGAELRRLSWDLEGTGMRLVVAPGVTELAGPRLVVRPMGGLPLLDVQESGCRSASWWLKLALDRVGATLLCIVLSPFFVVIALAIRLTSPGPVLFRQSRVGLRGARFTLLKFRTMYDGAEQRQETLSELNENDGVLFKIRRDPRVTPVGRFLRRFSLDELPQLWNVVTGTMSLIGPRPPLACEVDRYPGDLRRRRLLVRPGITGLWQVSGRSDLSWEETVRLDLQYVENWSVLLDATVLWKTFRAVISGRGAY